MLGFVRKKTLDEALYAQEALRRGNKRMADDLHQYALKETGLNVEIVRTKTERDAARIAEEKARADLKEALERIALLTAIQGTKWFRAGSVVLDPLRLTRELREVIKDARVEYDGERLWVFTQHRLTLPELQALRQRIPFKLDET